MNGGGKVGIRYDLATRTVKNTGDTDVELTELMEKVTKLCPGEEKTLEPDTKLIEVS